MATSNIPNNASRYTTAEEIHALSVADVVSEVKRAGRYIADADKRSKNATDWAAYATYMAVDSGAYGGESPIWATQEEFVNALGKDSKSLFGGWLTLGIALVDVGLDPESTLYQRLRNSNQYGVADVKNVIRAEGCTPEDVEKALAGRVDEHGKRIVKRAAKPDDGGEKGASALPTGKKLVEYVVEKGKEFRNAAENLSLDDWAEVETTMRSWLDEQNKARAEAAAAA